MTQDDIDNGKKRSGHYCPVSLAMKRELDVSTLFVTYSLADAVGTDGGYRLFSLPVRATQFIAAFDYDKPVEPFTFEVTEVVK